MPLLYNHPIAAAFVICAAAYGAAFVALGWPFGRRP